MFIVIIVLVIMSVLLYGIASLVITFSKSDTKNHLFPMVIGQIADTFGVVAVLLMIIELITKWVY